MRRLWTIGGLAAGLALGAVCPVGAVPAVAPPPATRVEAPAPPVMWQRDLRQAMVAAGQQFQPVLVLFSSPDCGWCRRMKAEALSAPEVTRLLAGFTLVEIDVTESPEVARQFQLRGVPTLAVMTSEGQVRAMYSGYLPPTDMQRFLRESLNPQFVRQQETNYLALVEAFNERIVPPHLWPDILLELRDPERRKELQPRIRALDPFPRAAMVELLGDPRLAVRLGATEVIEEVRGDVAGFDPWAGPEKVEANAVPLALLREWAAASAGAEGEIKRFSALTREQIESYVQDLVSADMDRATRARRMLEQASGQVFDVLNRFVEAHPDLPVDLRQRVREVQYGLTLGRVGDVEGTVMARRLLYGTLDVRLKALASIRGAGRRAAPVLVGFLDDPEPLVRETAVESLAAVGGRRAIPILEERLKKETDKDVVYAILSGLGELPDGDSVRILTGYLANADEDLVIAAIGSLARQKSTVVEGDLGKCLKDPRWRVRVAALDAIKALEWNSMAEEVSECLEDAEPFVRFTAVQVLAQLKLVNVKRLEAAFLREDALKGPVAEAFAALDIPLPPAFTAALAKASPEALLAVLDAMADGAAQDMLIAIPYVDHPNPDVAVCAVRLVARQAMSDARARAVVTRILRSGQVDKILAVLEALMIPSRDSSAGPWGGLIPMPLPGAEIRFPGNEQMESSPSTLDTLAAAFDGGGDVEGTTRVVTNAAAPSPSVSLEGLVGAFDTGEAQGEPAGPGASASGTAALATVGQAVRDCLAKSTNTDVRLAAAQVLLRWGSAEGLPILEQQLSTRPVEDRLRVLENLEKIYTTNALRLVEVMLQDSSESVRKAAAALCLDASRPAAFSQALWSAVIRRGTKLKAYEVPVGSLERSFQKLAVRRKTSDWARKALAESTETPVRILAAIVSEKVWRKGDDERLRVLAKDESPWMRRAAWHALGVNLKSAFTNDLGAILDDPSEQVRAVVPAVYGSGRPKRWVHYFDAQHFEEESEWVTDYGTRPVRMAPAVRAALMRLTEDPVAAVRVESFFALLENREPVDLTRMIETLEALPDPAVAANRVYQFLSSHYEELGPGFRLLVPWLEKMETSAYSRSEITKIQRHFNMGEKENDWMEVITRAMPTGTVEATFVDVAPAVTGAVPAKLVYFGMRGCQDCERVSRLLAEVKEEFQDVSIVRYDIKKIEALRLNEVLGDRFGVPERLRLVAPAVFASSGFLVRGDITAGALRQLVLRARGQPDSDWWVVSDSTLTTADARLKRRSTLMGFGVVSGAGLLDGMNPCAFATIIFLMSYLQVARRRPREVAGVGVAFILAVFITYYLLGLGLIEVVVRAERVLRPVRQVVNALLAVFSLVVMILNVRDGVLCLRGRMQDMTLQLPGMLKTGVHGVIRRGVRYRHFVLAAFGVGVVISVLELACTGQVYLPTIGYMLATGQGTSRALGYLLAYNVMFVVPLAVVFGLACLGMTYEVVVRFLQRHAAPVKFLTAVLFLGLFLFFVLGA